MAWPISGNPLQQEEFLQRLQIPGYYPGEQKLSQTTYNLLFAKWSGWSAQRKRDPFTEPVEDAINSLAELFREGYLRISIIEFV